MDLLELAKARWSVRKFSPRPLEREKLERILEAGQAAPTAANFQPQHIYVLQSEEALARINSLCRCIYGAKTVLLLSYDTERDWKNPQQAGIHSGEQDVSIVATHIMLSAWEQGVASCWVNAFANDQVAAAFGLPERERVVLLLPLGYAAEDAKPMEKWHFSRKPLADTVTFL
ncbi:MAG: nitroreductase family protein [Oscillibacter sp.]|nr:nitroreductase family protein [Oscillibacter sp.]